MSDEIALADEFTKWALSWALSLRANEFDSQFTQALETLL
jgi:hypothetical protein